MQILVAIIVLSVLIVIHELGHSIAAKATGIKVHEFSLFMGPKIFGIKIGETEYSIRAIPIGGFVKMEGEEEASEDRRAFNNKPIWARMCVVAAGPIVNLLYTVVAIALAMYLAVGFYLLPVVSDLVEGFPAEKAGLMVGDKILKMDDETIYSYFQLNMYVSQSEGREINVVVDRQGQRQEIPIKPTYNEEEKRYMIGMMPLEDTNFFGFIDYSIRQSFWFVRMTFQTIGMLLTGRMSADTLAGPIGIVNELGKAAVQGEQETFKDVLARLINFSAIISLSLGVLNFLPIPALDGSKLVLLGVEGVRRKPISPKKEAYISMIGFMFLIILMIYVSINDIRRLFMGQG